ASAQARTRTPRASFPMPHWLPQAEAFSLDHLVGTQQERFGNFQSNGLRGGEVDDKIELSRLLDRDIGRLCPAQNLVDEVAGAPVEAREVRSIGHETARFESFAVWGDFWPSPGEREATDPKLSGGGERLTNNIKGLRAILECLEGRCDIRRLPDFQGDRFDAERVGRGFNLVQLPHGR